MYGSSTSVSSNPLSGLNAPVSVWYENLAGQNSDALRSYSIHKLSGQPFTIRNKFPFPIELLLFGKGSNMQKLGPINAGGEILAELTPETAFQVYRRAGNGEIYEVCRSSKVRFDTRLINIGDIAYNSKSDRSIINLNADVPRVWIRNRTRLGMRIFVRRQGLPDFNIGNIQPDSGTGYMSGSPTDLYLDAINHGFQLGDELVFHLMDGTHYGTFKLEDQLASDIYLGITTYFDDVGVMPGKIFTYNFGEPQPGYKSYFNSRTMPFKAVTFPFY